MSWFQAAPARPLSLAYDQVEKGERIRSYSMLYIISVVLYYVKFERKSGVDVVASIG